MKQGVNLGRSCLRIDHAVDVGFDLSRITFVAVQHAIRNAGAIQCFEYTRQNPAGAAALDDIFRARHGQISRFER